MGIGAYPVGGYAYIKIGDWKQNMKDESKKVYILLSKTKTVPSNLIKLMTREPYCHTSLALDISLDEMYSFARKGVYNPFNSGFISENIEKGIFGKHKGTRCAVYELKVTSKQYDRIQQELARFKKHPDRYGYNFMGVFSVFSILRMRGNTVSSVHSSWHRC